MLSWKKYIYTFIINNIFSKVEIMENLSNNNFEDSNTGSPNTENENNYTNSYEHQHRPPINVFAFFARSLGIFAIICAIFSIFFGSFICGGLAIVLAILSKGYDTKMEKKAVIGLVAGCVAIVLQISSLAFSIYNIIHVPEYREIFNSMYEQINGEPVDESITDMLDRLGGLSQDSNLL